MDCRKCSISVISQLLFKVIFHLSEVSCEGVRVCVLMYLQFCNRSGVNLF